jgi:hypothetical protein
MIKNKLLPEIFEEFEKAENKQAKMEVIRNYWHPSLKLFLEYAFNPQVVFDAVPPENWRPAVEPAGLNVTYLDFEVTKLYRFIKGHPQRPEGLTPEKKTRLLGIVLESLHPSEAELLLKLMKKNLGIKGLTPKLIKEAFGVK